MVANEEHIPPLERFAAVLGRLDERTKQTQKTVEEIDEKVTDLVPRVLSLEEERKQRDRRSALIGVGGGIGGTGFIIAIWNALEGALRGMPK